MKITKVQAREIFDSRGFPTLECQLFLDNDVSVLASVPAGKSKGIHEALELRDGGARLFGKGVLKAIEYIEHTIGPELLGKEPDLFLADRLMIELDGTTNKVKLGANTMLAVSMAVTRAQAHAEHLELYELIAHVYGSQTVTLPFPLFNVINGGVHADNNMRIQEFMITPIGGGNFRDTMELGVVLFYELKALLKKAGKIITVGDEGGFACLFSTETEALDFLTEAITKIGNGDHYRIAIDVAASEFYNEQTHCYDWHGDFLTSAEMIALYTTLVQTYPIYSIEDGLSQDDWQGWMAMMNQMGDKIQIVGDDLFVTSEQRIKHGCLVNAANAVIIKPNQIGTITETLNAIQACAASSMNSIISHRSGETEDTFIADLAVGTSSGQIKAGGCSRSERLAKYNRLLRIEDQLIRSLMVNF